jgi:hypothetical protein
MNLDNKPTSFEKAYMQHRRSLILAELAFIEKHLAVFTTKECREFVRRYGYENARRDLRRDNDAG